MSPSQSNCSNFFNSTTGAAVVATSQKSPKRSPVKLMHSSEENQMQNRAAANNNLIFNIQIQRVHSMDDYNPTSDHLLEASVHEVMDSA